MGCDILKKVSLTSISILPVLLLVAAGCSSAPPTSTGSPVGRGAGSGGGPGAEGSAAGAPAGNAASGSRSGSGQAERSGTIGGIGRAQSAGAVDCGDGGSTSQPAYPAGPYGLDVGDVLDPSLSWQAYWPNQSTPATLTPNDLYDPDGSRGINAIWINDSSPTLGPSQEQASFIGTRLASGGAWANLGIAAVTLLVPPGDNSLAGAQSWLQKYNEQTTYVGVEGPSAPFLNKVGGTPANFLIDPRTMKITQIGVGGTGFTNAVPVLAQQNGGVASNTDGGSTSQPAYPAGPYGLDVGDVLDPSLSWRAYWPNQSAPATLTPNDLYDPDGSRGINAIWINDSSPTLGPSQEQASFIGTRLASGGAWANLGVAAVTLLVPPGDNSLAGAQSWLQKYNEQTTYVGVEGPSAPFLNKVGGTPANFLIDPRTMKITQIGVGGTGFTNAVPVLAQQNKK